MRKDKLYTVNKWNKPAFMPANYFDWGGLARADYNNQLLDNNIGNSIYANAKNAKDVTNAYMNSTNAFGISKAANPFSKGNLQAAFSKQGLSNLATGAMNAGINMGSQLVGQGLNSAISGGLQSTAGNAVNTFGNMIQTGDPTTDALKNIGVGAVSGALNRFFGSELNEAKIAEVEEHNNKLNQAANTMAGADKQDLLNNFGNLDLNYSFSQSDIGRDGIWANDAADKYEELKRAQDFAKQNALLGFKTGLQNVENEEKNRVEDNFIYGLGGKLFADGGLKAAFFDEFGSDPIGAAMRYKQGLERQAAEEEEAAMNAAREAEYLANQQRLANLETQYQGLQALMSAMPTNTSSYSEEPASSSSPSRAAYNSNWDYIEDQLRKSGKFNNVQIQGIKYNLQRESGIGKYDNGDNGTARGLAQWRGNRIPKDMSLEGQTRHLIDTLSNYDGKLHWIGEDNYRGFMNARTPEEAHYYIAKGYERPHKDIIAKVKRDSDMSLRHLNAFGGELGTNGADFTDGMIYIDEGGSHEENPLDGVPMGIDAEGIPNLVEEGETVYNDYVFSDRMKVPTFMYKELGLGGVIKKKGKGMSFADASKKLSQESEQRPNDPISKAGLDAALSRLAEVQETERMKQNAEEYMGLAEYACGGKLGRKFKNGGNSSSNNYDGVHADEEENTPEQIARMEAARKQAMPALGPGFSLTEVAERITPTESNLPAEATIPQQGIMVTNPYEDNYKPYQTWMRYAPAIGNGVMALTDALGITNKPDYTYADKIEGYARQAGKAPYVSYKPIGNYLRYNPMDIWFEQNRMDANARATDRAIMNNAAPIGTKMAGLLASGYNNQIANGQLYRSALEYNDAKRKDVAGFNRTTDMFNSQMGLEAAMANARYNQAAKQMGLSGLAQAASMRDAIDARVGAARSANLTNFLTSLGNIGRENFALNQINWDRSRRHGAKADGTSYDKVTGKACGGKINRRK